MISNELALNVLNSAEEDPCKLQQIGPPLMSTFTGIAISHNFDRELEVG